MNLPMQVILSSLPSSIKYDQNQNPVILSQDPPVGNGVWGHMDVSVPRNTKFKKFVDTILQKADIVVPIGNIHANADSATGDDRGRGTRSASKKDKEWQFRLDFQQIMANP